MNDTPREKTRPINGPDKEQPVVPEEVADNLALLIDTIEETKKDSVSTSLLDPNFDDLLDRENVSSDDRLITKQESKPNPVIGNDGIPRTIYNSRLLRTEIINGRVQVIEEPKKTTIVLKVTPEKIVDLMQTYKDGSDEIINYSNTYDELQFPAKAVKVGDTKISIFQGVDRSGRVVDTFEGVINLEFPAGRVVNEADIAGLLNLTPSEKSDEELASERDSYLHRMQNKTESPEGMEFSSEVVFPGYEASTIPKRTKELVDKYGPFYFSHTFIGVPPDIAAQNLTQIIQSGGLLSANERHKRHLFTSARTGNNPSADFRTGGAEYVFTNIVTKDLFNPDDPRGPIELVIDPSIANRVDWYSYSNDAYGSNPIKNNSKTEAPESALKRITQGDKRGEQFFSYGIGLEKIMFVACSTNEQRSALLRELLSNGIEEINGKPVEEWVVLQRTFGEIFDSIELGSTQLHRDAESHESAELPHISSFQRVGEYSDPTFGEVYEEIETNKRYFIKEYEDPSQPSCAYVSNRIYELCGVKVPKGRLINTETSRAYSMPYNTELTKAQERYRPDLKKWVVPMSFLLDWGAPFGDVIVDDLENVHLVNHEESLLFRGENKRKEGTQLERMSISEIDIIRAQIDPYTEKPIFDISDDEVELQAKLFLLQVAERDIVRIIDEAQFNNADDKNELLDLLLSRRRFLEETYSH